MTVAFNTPILLLVFNRPETTAVVLKKLSEIRPKDLFVVSDGPRKNNSADVELCERVKGMIDLVDWPCTVHKNYSETNLGCRNRVSSGISWFFDNVEQGIILEDDCVPDISFFPYCEELLLKFKDDDRIGHIGGTNPISELCDGKYNIYYSKHNNIWGWASWRRAWKDYDVDMRHWPEIRETEMFAQLFSRKQDKLQWYRAFDQVYRKELDTWDYQWTFACWLSGRLSVLPRRNLVSNIGFGVGATHTSNTFNGFANLKVFPFTFPIKYPPWLLRDYQCDKKREIKESIDSNRLLLLIRRLASIVFSLANRCTFRN